MPGLATSAGNLYISAKRWLQTTSRSLPSNMRRPCDMLSSATRMRALWICNPRVSTTVATAIAGIDVIPAQKRRDRERRR
jgi:hypothetical protein